MKDLAEKILNILDQYTQVMEINCGINTTLNIDSDKWSINQIFGHLIDSASNNHQRITRMKIQVNSTFPDYNKDEWIEVGNYNNKDYTLLFSLFIIYNKLISSIISDIENTMHDRKLLIKWQDKDEISLKQLCNHYLEHLKFHLDHLLERISEINNLTMSSSL